MANNRLKTWLYENLTKLKPIGTALIFAPWILVVYWIIAEYSLRLGDKDLEIIASFIEWFGTAYSLFLALVLANAWSQYDTLEREFDQELDAIISLYDNMKFIKDPKLVKGTRGPAAVRKIYSNIKKYVRHVIENYEFEGKFSQQRRNGDMILEEIGKDIRSWTSSNASRLPEPITSELFDSLNTAIDVRGDRISHSKQGIPKTVWSVAVISSILWLIPFLVLRIEDSAVKFIMKVGVAFIIVIVLTIISDLDSPFEGTWKIGLEAWDDFLGRIEYSPQLIFVFNINNDIREQIRNLTGECKCKLNKFSHTGLFGFSWSRMLDRVSRKKPDENIKSVSVYSNQLGPCGYATRITVPEFPSVIIRKGDDFIELMNSHDIDGCSDLKDFEKVLSQRL